MLIPRFTVRWLLFLTTVCAGLAFVVSLGVAGQSWAIALAVTFAAFALMVVFYICAFCLAWASAAGWGLINERRTAASPFAMHTPPPQILPPVDPD